VVTDHLGAPRALLDEAGEIAWKAQIDLYGVARTDVMRTRCPWRWPGQYEDEETGLYYNRFRYYDPEAGRYINQDPIGLVGDLNLYTYPHDTLRWVDPLGLMPLSAWERKIANLLGMGEKTIRELILARGGAGNTVNEVASDLRDMKLKDVAKLAAAENEQAEKAIKLVKQADNKRQKYSGCKKR